MQTTDAQSTAAATSPANPLLAKWEGPYGGVPPFDRVQVADFKPALEAGMAENLAEVERIAKNTAAPTFENTIVALEATGQTLDRVQTIYGVFGSTMNGPEFQVVQREMAPRLSAFNDQITQNEALFKRIEAVYNSPEKAKLDARSSSAWPGFTTQTSFAPALAWVRKQGAAVADQPKTCRTLHEVLVKTFWRKKTGSSSC